MSGSDPGPLVAVAQLAPGGDPVANLAAITRLVERAVDLGAALVVLPEYAAWFDRADVRGFAAHAEPLDGPFVTALTALAARLGVHLVAGLVAPAGERSPEDSATGERVANVLVAVDGGGVVAVHRKQHLYDAFGERESDRVAPGPLSAPQVFPLEGMTVGMQTCYDVRFPEVSRRLADAGADLLLVPAQWVPGPLKEHHWRTLVTARAIENTAYVAAAGQTPPAGIGSSLVVDPMGVVLAGLGAEEGVALAPASAERIREVRAVNPALALRRYAVVPR